MLVLVIVLAVTTASAAEPEKQESQTGKGVLVAVGVWLGLFVTAIGAGYSLGKARSPNYPASQEGFQEYIADRVRESPMWERKRTPAGELAELTRVWTCRFVAGIHVFVYDSKSGTYHVEAPARGEVVYSGVPLTGFSQAQLTVAAGTAGSLAVWLGTPTSAFGGTVAAGMVTHAATPAGAITAYGSLISSSSGLTKMNLIVLGVAGVAAGLYLGRKWAYRKAPNLSADPLQKWLNDMVFWQGVANLRGGTTRSWTFETHGSAVLAKRSGEVDFANVRRASGTPAAIPNPSLLVAPLAPKPGALSTPAAPNPTPSTGKPVLAPGLLAGSLGFSSPFATILGGFRLAGPGSYVASTPPPDLISDLKAAGEDRLAARLVAQENTPLGGWTLGFPL